MKNSDMRQIPVRLEALGQQHQFFSYRMRVSDYPVPPADREDYLALLARLEDLFDRFGDAGPEILLQMWKLHHEAASKQLSKHGKEWMPMVGVGVWPHKPAPAVWTREEFEAFAPGEIPRPPISMVFRLQGNRSQCANVLSLMGGRGAVIQAWLLGKPEEFYKDCENYFRSFITEPLHLAYPFFFPLIDAGTLPAVAAEVADRLLRHLQFYVRESAEDRGLLILSRSALDNAFEDLHWEIERHRQS